MTTGPCHRSRLSWLRRDRVEGKMQNSSYIFTLAEVGYATTCQVATELSPDTALQTIHENVLCLHERLDAAKETEDNRRTDSESIVVMGSSRGVDNPCPVYAECSRYILIGHLQEICAAGNCADGFMRWYKSMPYNWRSFLDANTQGTTFTLSPQIYSKGILDQPNLWIYDGSKLMFNIKQLFQNVPPDTVFNKQSIVYDK